MEAGRILKLKVVRKTDLGYMVTDSKDEVLLHFKEATEELKIDQEVEVFIYFDKKGRLCATMSEPFVTLDKPGFAEVVEVISNIGVFVNINTGKDILVSLDYLPYNRNQWPEIGDKLLIGLKLKKDVLVGKPLNRFEIEEIKGNVEYEINSMIPAYVCRTGEIGINLVTDDIVNVFVHKSLMREKYRLGQMVVVRISHLGAQGYDGSLIAQKEKMIDPDKESILAYLKANSGRMRLDAKSTSEEIEAILHISRKAFKRALGALYKEETVYFEDGYTILK